MIRLNKLDKSKSRLLLFVGVATVVTIFSLVSAYALLDQANYHRKELNAKRAVIKQLEANIATSETLRTQYEIFNGVNPNFIGGKNSSDPNAAPPDGDNARLVLNALPSTYDFPALISSVSHILSGAGLANPGIAGSDQGATTPDAPIANPTPLEIPLSINGVTSYNGAQSLLKDLERSIRPFDVTSLQLGGSADSVSLSIGMTTYFQPAKDLGSSSSKEVK